MKSLNGRVVSLSGCPPGPARRWWSSAVAAALDWAMTPGDRRTWRALLATYAARLGTHPDAVDPGDLDAADWAAMLEVHARAYARLGWPIRPDAA